MLKTNLKIKLCVALWVLLTGVLPVAAQSVQTTEIKPIKGEKWWGLVVDTDKVALPFSAPFSFGSTDFSPTTYRADMMLSNRGRYVWSSTPLMVTYDGTKLVVSTTTADGSGQGVGKPTVQKAGRSLREAYLMCCHKNFPPKATPADRMLFSAPIYELGGEDAILYTQQDVVEFADMLQRRGAPKGTILLPQGWNSPTGAPTFDIEAYPNPKELIDALHKQGMKVMLTITPYVPASGRGYRQSLREGRLMTDRKGEPIVFESRQGYTACRTIDKAAAAELNSALKALQADYGVDGFYFDCLDALPLFGGSRGVGGSLDAFLTAWHGAAEGLSVAVYSTPTHTQLGSVASSVSPSRAYTWEALGKTLETAIDASVLGYTRTCIAADLNFATVRGKADQRLILRTAQVALLLPVAIVPYAVWSVDNSEAVDRMLALRSKIGPYVLSLAEESVNTAEPIIRHLEYQFPRTGFSNCRDEYMIGNRYLVAPVISDTQGRMVRLPKGKWKDAEGRKIKGPRVIDVALKDGEVAIFEADN